MTKQIKVLMVDDEKRFRETTKKILNKKDLTPSLLKVAKTLL